MNGWIGIDVGGANLKAARGDAFAVSRPFALWREPERLGDELRRLIAAISPYDGAPIALTMTGELADCFATKAEGVRAIVAATADAAAGATIRVASLDDRWRTVDETLETPTTAAAANWRVAARLVAKLHPRGGGLWIDVGSTTTDVVPIRDGAVASRGLTDPERLVGGELIYTGVRRTPVCAIVNSLPYRGGDCPVAAEWFATSADAWLLLGELPEDPLDTSTADGRPFTHEHSIARLARCVCADRDSFGEEHALLAAEQIASRQTSLVAAALDSAAPPDWVVVSGEGEFLGRRISNASWETPEPRSIRESVGDAASRCLPAYACAVLAAEEIGKPP